MKRIILQLLVSPICLATALIVVVVALIIGAAVGAGL